MTKKRLEYDRKRITPTNMTDWTWLKHHTDEHERLYMTEITTKMTKIYTFGHNHTNRLVVLMFFMLFYTFGHIHTNRLVVLVVWFWLFDFGHIQPFMFVVVILFQSSSNVHVRRFDPFGQVHIFRSCSFGHVDSVKWLFLE